MQLAVLGASSLFSGAGLFKATILGASIAGSMIMNGRKKPTGKLNDVRVSSASYGRGIPKIWGTMRVTGNMFWATDFREEKVYVTQKGKQKSGGKGKMKGKKGKAQPVYKYYANFAMGLAEGPMADVLRIWADNNLIYNKLNPDDDDLVGPGFSTRDQEESGKRSMKSAGGKKGQGGASGRFAWRFYAGDEQQMPDPFMEEQEGVGKVPAYRDLCYLMFQDFALEDFGNRIPTITAEVVSKVTRKPQLIIFENMEPPTKNWYRPDFGSKMIDIVRGTLFMTGLDENEDRVVRMWDMDTRKEVKRLKYVDVLPQTVPHGEAATPMTSSTLGTRTWTKANGNDFEEFGTTPSGDLVLYKFEGNYGPILFMDPSSGKIIKSWGRSGNILADIWNGIFAPGGAFPIIGSGYYGNPVPYTLVYEVFGRIHIFDEYYNKIGTIESEGRRTNYRQGSIGTEQALLMTSTDYAGVDRFNFYYAPVVGPYMGKTGTSKDLALGFEPSRAYETKLGQWPEVRGSKGDVLVMYDMAYIVGANCIGIIAGPAGGTPWVASMDIMTGKILWEKRLDGISWAHLNLNGFRSPKSYINTNGWTIEGGPYIVKIDFHLQTVDIQIGREGYTNVAMRDGRYYWSERDAMIGFATIGGEITPVIQYQDRKVQDKVDIAQIVTDVAERVGIEPDRVRTSGIETQEPLLGYMFEQPVDARSVLEELANVYQFDCVETDNMLVFKMRGGAPLVTIQEEQLGVIEADIGTDNERLSETIQQAMELPERVTVSYYDPKNDYETGSQYFKRPGRPLPVMSTKEHLEVTFNMSLLSKDAKAMAKRILYAAWSERTTQEFRLPRDFLFLDASDVVTIQLKDGRAIECRITDMTMGANMELEVVSVANLAESYLHTATTEQPQGTVNQPGGSVAFATPMVANIPYIDDNHQNLNVKIGYYWGAGAHKPGFNFGMLQSRIEDTNWSTDGYTQVDAIWGYTKQPVPPPANGWNIQDDETEINLIPAFDFNEQAQLWSWETIPDEEWPSTQNMIIIGDEVILFKNAVENSDGSVTISALIRGYRGTIDAAYRHGNGDTWMIYTENSVHLASDSLEYLDKDQQFIVNTGNVLAPFVASKTLALTGGTERPLPVGNVRRTNLANGDVRIQWSRATRIGGAMSNNGSVPLNEESERYYLFLLPGEYDAKKWDPEDDSLYVWKSEILTSGQVIIPAATLGTLSLSNRRDLNVVIHQMSANVEWGFPLGTKLPYALIGV
ncbi:hypothetical protein HNR26_003880 [Rhizobium rosettiformans]|uniref:Uncharacterized protein n=2 Tax=Rhizobium rosettiformans TaxID=1368430 RepID=A0A4S8PTF8_9HYPH|nr:phage tail protein [Rhizobium rosettiformans]MBB5277791.1 hypothetical protein [Rhizobium rosettiformans]THV32952.1 hypothetical protein FAA86_18855 [Rhizobium rosettiformans W3]